MDILRTKGIDIDNVFEWSVPLPASGNMVYVSTPKNAHETVTIGDWLYLTDMKVTKAKDGRVCIRTTHTSVIVRLKGTHGAVVSHVGRLAQLIPKDLVVLARRNCFAHYPDNADSMAQIAEIDRVNEENLLLTAKTMCKIHKLVSVGSTSDTKEDRHQSTLSTNIVDDSNETLLDTSVHPVEEENSAVRFFILSPPLMEYTTMNMPFVDVEDVLRTPAERVIHRHTMNIRGRVHRVFPTTIDGFRSFECGCYNRLHPKEGVQCKDCGFSSRRVYHIRIEVQDMCTESTLLVHLQESTIMSLFPFYKCSDIQLFNSIQTQFAPQTPINIICHPQYDPLDRHVYFFV